MKMFRLRVAARQLKRKKTQQQIKYFESKFILAIQNRTINLPAALRLFNYQFVSEPLLYTIHILLFCFYCCMYSMRYEYIV